MYVQRNNSGAFTRITCLTSASGASDVMIVRYQLHLRGSDICLYDDVITEHAFTRLRGCLRIFQVSSAARLATEIKDTMVTKIGMLQPILFLA